MIAALAANLFAMDLGGPQTLPQHFRAERLSPKHPEANTPPAPVNSARPLGTHAPSLHAEPIEPAHPAALDPRPFWQHLERLNLQHPAVPVPGAGAKACVKPRQHAPERATEALYAGAQLCRPQSEAFGIQPPRVTNLRETIRKTTPILMHSGVPARAGIIDLVA